MDGHRLHAGWASTTLVLSPVGPAMVSRAGVWFVAGPVHPYWIEKVKLSKREARLMMWYSHPPN